MSHLRETACGWCGAPVVWDGRAYDPPGFPYLHECAAPPLHVPNESDFCRICRALSYKGVCDTCERRRERIGRPVERRWAE